jgi:ADP-ribosylglycohydrolase
MAGHLVMPILMNARTGSGEDPTQPPDPSMEDRVRGVLFGHAAGDALGLGAEFLSRDEVVAHYPTGLHTYDQIVRDEHRERWAPGDWTDDTTLMLCIADSLLARGKLDTRDIVRRFIVWARDDGRGLGRHMARVIGHEDFWDDPVAASHAVWEATGRRAAPNGALMRTSVLGVWQWHDEAAVVQNAVRTCQLTHADPRCVASCVAVCVAIAAMLRDAASPADAFSRARSIIHEACAEFEAVMDIAAAGDLAALDLDEGCNAGEPDRIGYTFKALGAGFWALCHARSFEDGLLQVIHEGGDADTNGCVAGALLGARFGFQQIPPPWVHALRDGKSLDSRASRFLDLCMAPARSNSPSR